jgi:hypothetical protein
VASRARCSGDPDHVAKLCRSEPKRRSPHRVIIATAASATPQRWRPGYRAGGGEVDGGDRLPHADAHELHRVVGGDARELVGDGPLGGGQHGDAKYRDDRHALAALLRVVPAEMQAGLANKETAREAWESIRRIHIGADRVKEANVERLRQEFAEMRFKPGECVEDFSLRITALANQL